MPSITRSFLNKLKYLKEKQDHFHNIEKMRKGFLIEALSSTQKKEIQQYYNSHFGRSISLKWHEYYKSVNHLYSPEYIPTYLYYTKIYPKLNDTRMMVVYSDKNMIDKLIPGVNIPKTYIKNINGYYYINGKPSSEEDAYFLCNNLNDAIIKHSIDTCQGKSVSRFSSHDGKVILNRKEETSIDVLLRSYGKDYIVQEAIQQSPTMSLLNPTSLNTVRIMTYKRVSDVVVLFSVVRMGRTGSVVDNASAGGLYCGVNLDGTLKPDAYTLSPFSRTDKSDNGIYFKNFRINKFEEMKALAISMHNELPYAKIIGWDLSLDINDNIVLVEINAHAPGLFQAATGPAFREYTAEILELTK